MEPTRVRVGYEFLRNLGNFQNIKVKVEIEDNVRQDEKISEARDRVALMAEQSLIKQIVEIEAKLDDFSEGN